jgi:hypothetical protein
VLSDFVTRRAHDERNGYVSEADVQQQDGEIQEEDGPSAIHQEDFFPVQRTGT